MVLKFYVDIKGRCPFQEWLQDLDVFVRNRVIARMKRLEAGNFGDIKPCGLGVSELRFFYGGGLRVYLGITKEDGIILLGGNKSTQSSDILYAQSYWLDYLERQNNE